MKRLREVLKLTDKHRKAFLEWLAKAPVMITKEEADFILEAECCDKFDKAQRAAIDSLREKYLKTVSGEVE